MSLDEELRRAYADESRALESLKAQLEDLSRRIAETQERISAIETLLPRDPRSTATNGHAPSKRKLSVRQAISEVLSRSGVPLTLAEIYGRIEHAEFVGHTSTSLRTLVTNDIWRMKDRGEIEQIETPEGRKYRWRTIRSAISDEPDTYQDVGMRDAVFRALRGATKPLSAGEIASELEKNGFARNGAKTPLSVAVAGELSRLHRLDKVSRPRRGRYKIKGGSKNDK